MGFKEQLVADQAVFANPDEFGEMVDYQSSTDPNLQASIMVVMSINSDLSAYVANNTQARMATVEVWKKDIPAPGRYDTITTADGTVWAVESIIQEDSTSCNLLISTAVRAS